MYIEGNISRYCSSSASDQSATSTLPQFVKDFFHRIIDVEVMQHKQCYRMSDILSMLKDDAEQQDQDIGSCK